MIHRRNMPKKDVIDQLLNSPLFTGTGIPWRPGSASLHSVPGTFIKFTSFLLLIISPNFSTTCRGGSTTPRNTFCFYLTLAHSRSLSLSHGQGVRKPLWLAPSSEMLSPTVSAWHQPTSAPMLRYTGTGRPPGQVRHMFQGFLGTNFLAMKKRRLRPPKPRFCPPT